MGKIKEIFIDTMNETRDASHQELLNLLTLKNEQLDLKDDDIENLTDDELISLIAQKNLLIKSKEIKK